MGTDGHGFKAMDLTNNSWALEAGQVSGFYLRVFSYPWPSVAIRG
jgi:hypothetical protein